MRIVQVILPTATAFEQKCQRVDYESLREGHDVTVVASPKDTRSGGIAHFYGAHKQTIAKVGAKKRWFSAAPTIAISPVEAERFVLVPECVEEPYFGSSKFEVRSSNSEFGLRTSNFELLTVGVFSRPTIKNILALTIARVHRTREDVDFLLFDEAPTPAELQKVNVWLDPAADAHDFDGFVAEAVVAGLPVVAARTPINVLRLEKGRTGFLVPPGDPNELTHAILSALFKPEAAQQKIDAARQTMSKFRPRQRLRALTPLYESLLS